MFNHVSVNDDCDFERTLGKNGEAVVGISVSETGSRGHPHIRSRSRLGGFKSNRHGRMQQRDHMSDGEEGDLCDCVTSSRFLALTSDHPHTIVYSGISLPPLLTLKPLGAVSAMYWMHVVLTQHRDSTTDL